MKYIEETGIVKSVEKGSSTIRLDNESKEECGSCCACSAFSGGLPEIEVAQDNFEVGERVKVTIPRANPYWSIFFVFVFPLVLLMGGIIIGQHLEGDPRLGARAAGGGIIGLVTAMVVAWLANKILSPDDEPKAEKLTQ